ncbi:hypothetical protein [Sphingomonas morindae]|uniref:Alpha/beta hydrolase n=1 Tax=Sphingomonas morindae TaxID=1541170 RepID=A0ABY4X5G1_9SPHN|nr:hypothetical protein [Sphingomonas morindae]USI72114.1 hypothetical protein LHA26_12470 [Sphingomonas morindae]
MIPAAPRVLELGAAFVLHYGDPAAPPLILLQPLFEEANRCRALLAGLARALAQDGFGLWLPDLPGTGESPAALDRIGWADWQALCAALAAHVAASSGRPPRTVALRGGALLDGIGVARWRLSPADGAALLRDRARAARLGDGAGEDHPLAPTLAAPLAAATPQGAARTARLRDDPAPADVRLAGAPLWRRAEPAADADLLAAMAEDIRAWARA